MPGVVLETSEFICARCELNFPAAGLRTSALTHLPVSVCTGGSWNV